MSYLVYDYDDIDLEQSYELVDTSHLHPIAKFPYNSDLYLVNLIEPTKDGKLYLQMTQFKFYFKSKLAVSIDFDIILSNLPNKEFLDGIEMIATDGTYRHYNLFKLRSIIEDKVLSNFHYSVIENLKTEDCIVNVTNATGILHTDDTSDNLSNEQFLDKFDIPLAFTEKSDLLDNTINDTLEERYPQNVNTDYINLETFIFALHIKRFNYLYKPFHSNKLTSIEF